MGLMSGKKELYLVLVTNVALRMQLHKSCMQKVLK